jgi:hypothetical protein
MPDLSGLVTVEKSLLIHQLVGVEAGFPEKMLAYRRNFIRLVDKAVRDYTDVRNCVLLLIEQQKSHTLEIAGGRIHRQTGRLPHNRPTAL